MSTPERPQHDEQSNLENLAKQLASKTTTTSSGQLDLLASVGGIRGIAEAVVPALMFLIVFIVTSNIWAAAGIAVGVAAIASILRLIQRQPVTQAVAGVIGVGISALVAVMQDDARGYYVIGFYISAAYGTAFLLSVLVRWPLLGLIYGWLRGEGVAWQRDALRRRKYQIATLLMAGVFFARLIVQLPMYWAAAGDDSEIVALGIARLVMGVPLYALVLWLGWLITQPKQIVNESDSQTT